MNEIRDFGDNRTIVLYTDDRELATRVSNWQQCYKIIPYEQEQKGRVALIGVDLYLPKRLKRRMEKIVNE